MMPYRSAVTGEYVTTEFAAANPDTTVWEDDVERDVEAVHGADGADVRPSAELHHERGEQHE